MISVERMKELLNDPKLTDKEVEEIRDEYRALAEIIYEHWIDQKEKTNNLNP